MRSTLLSRLGNRKIRTIPTSKSPNRDQQNLLDGMILNMTLCVDPSTSIYNNFYFVFQVDLTTASISQPITLTYILKNSIFRALIFSFPFVLV